MADPATDASPSELTVELGLTHDERDRFLTDLRGKMTMGGTGRVTFTPAAEVYSTRAYPPPSAPATDPTTGSRS